MAIFKKYLKKYWRLCILVLALALINQFFSLLEPYITQLLVDRYATHFTDFARADFFRGVGILILAFIGTALVSRVAKNFQDYYLNTISRKSGADMYREGVRHSLALPYAIFEDERSGETLGKLQKARQDTEKLISALVNILFVSLVGFVFVAIYATSIYWGIAVAFFGSIPIIAGLSMLLSNKIKNSFNNKDSDSVSKIGQLVGDLVFYAMATFSIYLGFKIV